MPKQKIATSVLLDLIEKHGPACVAELNDLTFFTHPTLNRVGRELLSEKKVHIVDWINNNPRGGKPAPVYAFGPGRSKPRPKSTPARESMQKRESALRRRTTNPTLAKIQNMPSLNGNPFGSLIAQI